MSRQVPSDQTSTNANDTVLQVEHLSKELGGTPILTDCNLAMRQGEVCAIIGPNGAGKTTLFKALTGLIQPTTGSISILGRRFTDETRDRILADIGVSIEVPGFRAGATARDVLQLHFDTLGIEAPSIPELLTKVGLADVGDKQVSAYSLGMRQRLALARAIGHRPRLLILDEPSNGLDPTGIADFRTLLGGLAADGITILVASHILTELEHIVDSVAVLNGGRLSPKRPLSDVLNDHADGLEGYYRASVLRSA